MITEILVTGLRGIVEGHLGGLGPLVVLVGPNGCGKSTILDALLIGGGNNPADAIGRTVLRRPYSWNGARWLFSRQSEERQATIGIHRTRQGVEEERSTVLAWQEQPLPEVANALAQYGRPEPYCAVTAAITLPSGKAQAHVGIAANNVYLPYQFVGGAVRGWEMRLVDSPQRSNQPLDEVYSIAVEKGRKKVAIDALKAILGESVKDITLLVDNREPVVHVVYEDGSVPVSIAGDGVVSFTRIALDLAGRPGGTVLLEEPETHQHPKMIWQTAEIIWATVARGVQVVLTTHSLELIDGLLAKAPPGQLEQLAVYRLKLANGVLISTRISGEDALTARSDFEDDLR